jgi:hypothetical protein
MLSRSPVSRLLLSDEYLMNRSLTATAVFALLSSTVSPAALEKAAAKAPTPESFFACALRFPIYKHSPDSSELLFAGDGRVLSGNMTNLIRGFGRAVG